MKKVTKKKLRKTALKLLPAIYDSAMRTGAEDGLFQHEDWRNGLCLDAFLLAEAFEDAAAYRDAEREQPKLKVLNQSVFDGLDEDIVFAAVDADGRAFVFDTNPELMSYEWDVCLYKTCRFIGDGYDASNWKNSLIERDKVELTGSDLCRAMLERGDKYVMCLVFDDTRNLDTTYVIRGYHDGYFHTARSSWENAIPINNQGEPLTASEVGL